MPAIRKARCELVKDILAMANTLGGYIVIGVSEISAGWSFDGMSEQQTKTFDSTKINGFVQNYSDPPINCVVYKVRHEAKNFVILEVPQFPDTPHICQKDYPGTLGDRVLYMRTDNNESAPLRTSSDFRILIGRAVQNKSDELLQSMRAVLKGFHSNAPQPSEQFSEQIVASRKEFAQRNPLGNKDYDYFLEVAFIPASFVNRRFGVEKLRQTAFEASVDFIGWPFLPIHSNRPEVLNVFEDGLESFWYTDDYFGGKILDFWRLYQSGLFYKKELLVGRLSTAGSCGLSNRRAIFRSRRRLPRALVRTASRSPRGGHVPSDDHGDERKEDGQWNAGTAALPELHLPDTHD